MSPRKVRLVADLIRGKTALRAESQLRFLPKRASEPILKLLKSAVANAEHNFNLEKRNLYISKITVDGGSVIKRYRPRAFGRSAPIRKRTSHINLVLEDYEGYKEEDKAIFEGSSTLRKQAISSDPVKDKSVLEKDIPGRPRRPLYKGGSRIAKKSAGFVKRMFRRKAI